MGTGPKIDTKKFTEDCMQYVVTEMENDIRKLNKENAALEKALKEAQSQLLSTRLILLSIQDSLIAIKHKYKG